MEAQYYTLVSMQDFLRPVGWGQTFIKTRGIFHEYKAALDAGKMDYMDEFAIGEIGRPSYIEQLKRKDLLPGEEKYTESLHEPWRSSEADEIELEVPLQYIWINKIFSKKFRDMTPEQGAELVDYNPYQQLKEIKESDWYRPSEMYIPKNPAYCYRVEPYHYGDFYTMVPKPYEDTDAKTPRIPLCRKLPSCTSAAGWDPRTYIYMSVEPLVTVLPSSKLVFDAPVTGERWVIAPRLEVNFVCIGEADYIGQYSKLVDIESLALNPIHFVNYGRHLDKRVIMDYILNDFYYQVFKADQQALGVEVFDPE